MNILSWRKQTNQLFLKNIFVISLLLAGEILYAAPVPTGVIFHVDTIYRSREPGDNWCITWAKDDSQITSMCDGNWLKAEHGFHNHLYHILNGPLGFIRKDIPGYPQFVSGTGSWFGYGIVAVGNNVYSVVSKTPENHWSGPFRGIKLLKSRDNGKTWFRINRNGEERLISPNSDARNEVNPDEMFFLEEYGLPHQKQLAYPFSYVNFVEAGRANQAAQDDYIYIYSPEGAHSNQLLLARVPKDKIGFRDEWRYFKDYNNGEPKWTSNIEDRGYVYSFPDKTSDGDYFGWYSWLPSVVWNPGLKLYIMVDGGTCAGPGMSDSDKDYYNGWMHTRSGSLGFWYSKNPYGPWKQFYYKEYWTADNPKNLTYQPKLSPKWISEDGKEMILIWSDAMKNKEGRSHTVNYKWNQMKITIQTSQK